MEFLHPSEQIHPQHHGYTRKIIQDLRNAESFAKLKAMQGVTSADIESPGLIKIGLSPSSDYSHNTMSIIIGGFGLGCDDDVMWGGPKRAPIAVRYVSLQPFSLSNVDDTGYVGAEFWMSSAELTADASEPAIEHIVAQALNWLQGACIDDNDKFREALEYTKRKHETIEAFRNLVAPTPELLSDSAHLTSACLVPNIVEREVSNGVYSFPLFTSEFCTKLIGIIDSYEATDFPKRRPNTMNNYGLVINDVGLKPLMDDLLMKVVAPLAQKCFPNELFTSTLDHHHSFVVVYKGKELGLGDRKLDMHHDAAEVTLNVCLGRDGFTASGLRFCGNFGDSNHRQEQYTHSHTIGNAVMHLGRQRHGADSINTGERINLIMWARSSAFRAAAAYQHVNPDGYPQEKETIAPNELCLSKPNDRDYELQIKSLERTGHTLAPDCGCTSIK